MKKTLGEKVGAVAKKERAEHTKRFKHEAEDFKQRYNKQKVFEFPPKDKINMEQHFYIPKGFNTLNGLTTPAMAIYPVLCSMADFETDNWFQMSRENIAKIAGINPLTVDKGIENLMGHNLLDDMPILERQMKTEGKRHFYMYRVRFVRKNMMVDYKGQFFIFHNCIIQSGVWAELSPRAKALYLAIRSIAIFDWQGYADEHDIPYSEGQQIYGEDYKDREWDCCSSTLSELCRMVNIDSSNIKEVLQQLKYHHLVERSDDYFRVYLKPKIRGLY